ncbi:hypothetical protein BN59_00031 [Legionella massiliensis]|uniref:Uncharacterized protein n=1 Tax=Legionella massiliensis TaxID=1034943 RepID=A0A078KVM1_9GAMM|nr:hypothetical protein [Legionella massiliensis]CDZ75773.1 hypothetical protein BN59_00031 [Legionella massiliensis]CEE11511.1 hypothetical protein BN1094_00031 [Legionella massiliensis]
MKIAIRLFITLFIFSSGTLSYAYNIRNTYPAKLICIQTIKPHSRYEIPANLSPNYDKVPFLAIKKAGEYQCNTADKAYSSVCTVSDIQEAATFDTNDGSASCTTPVKIMH